MSDFTEAQWAKAGAASRARANAVREPIQAAVRSATVRGLDSVPFASGVARDLAMGARLSWVAFEESGVKPSASSGYTAADVRRVVMLKG